MKKAYLILAHKNPEQLNRLIESLEGDIFIHLDKKKDIKEFYNQYKNVRFIKKRIKVNWGGYSLVEATINLIKEAYLTSDYDYYILLSGDDYPIKSNAELDLFLKLYSGKSFIEYESFNDRWKHLKYRYNYYYLSEKRNLLIRIIQRIVNIVIKEREMYNSLEAFKGSQWWCLNKEAIEYILKYIKQNKNIIKYFKHTSIPDEMFFQTILINYYPKDKIINNNLRYILLGDKKHPDILTKKHFKSIRESKAFFARKFDTNIDNEILDYIDAYL